MLGGKRPVNAHRLAGVALLATMSACTEPARAPSGRGTSETSVELATFQVRADQVYRFEHCPPPGDIGQDWVPPIPEWHPPAAASSSAGADGATGSDAFTAPLPSGDVEASTPATMSELTDEAGNQTRGRFRSCYHHGLLFDPTQDGHVAVVMRVDRAGKVAAVETWGACDLAPEAMVCIRDEAKHVKLRPPAGGAATITIPAVFTNAAERHGAPNDAYAAGAYVAVEAMRPRLHRCEEAAHRSHESVFASAVMSIDVDAKGRGTHVSVDQWKGGHEVLGCAAEVLRDAPFAAPPGGVGRIVVPVVFNPRPGTR